MKHTLHFVKAKETKGTFMYEETVPKGGEAVTGSFYVRKVALPATGAPEKLKVTIEAES